MSFADLKKQSKLGSLTAKLVKEVEKMNNSGGSGDDRLWKLDVDKSGNGYAVIRFLPAPDGEDLPEIAVDAINTFNLLNDRIYSDVGYIGKDYTNLNYYIEFYQVTDKEYFLELLHWLDSRAIQKSSDALKREHEKLKRKTSGRK